MLRALAALPLGLALLLAQDAATHSPLPGPSSEPVIKVTTRLVQVSVVVHDHHGNAVSDLKKEDFEVTDQGKPKQ